MRLSNALNAIEADGSALEIDASRRTQSFDIPAGEPSQARRFILRKVTLAREYRVTAASPTGLRELVGVFKDRREAIAWISLHAKS